MRKIVLLSLICVISFLNPCLPTGRCVISVFAQEEKITLTTYYPAPFGVYDELKSAKMWIGKDKDGNFLSGGPNNTILQVGGTTTATIGNYSYGGPATYLYNKNNVALYARSEIISLPTLISIKAPATSSLNNLPLSDGVGILAVSTEDHAITGIAYSTLSNPNFSSAIYGKGYRRGVLGECDEENCEGVRGKTSAKNGIGIYGYVEGESAKGVSGYASGDNGIGVFGLSSKGNGVVGAGPIGVHGQSQNTAIKGLYLGNKTSEGYALYGEGNSGIGCAAKSTEKYGLFAYSLKNRAIYAQSSFDPFIGEGAKEAIYAQSAGTATWAIVGEGPGGGVLGHGIDSFNPAVAGVNNKKKSENFKPSVGQGSVALLAYTGVYGEGKRYGVFGLTDNNIGVLGYATDSYTAFDNNKVIIEDSKVKGTGVCAIGKNKGIYAKPIEDFAAGGVYAGYFEGQVYIKREGGGTLIALQIDGGKLNVNGEAHCLEGAWSGSSREFKKNITFLSKQEYADILSKIEKINVVTYNLKEEALDSKRHIGIISEEGPEEIVSSDKKSIGYSEYSAFLLAGIKAQQEEIKELKQKIEKLEKKINK